MNNKFKLLKQSMVVLLLTTFASFQLAAQNITSALELKQLKTSDGNRIFHVKLTGESEAGTVPVADAKIELFSVSEGKSVSIGIATTNHEGKGFLIPEGVNYLKNKEGISEIKATFTGRGKLSGSEASVKFKELNLQVTLAGQDSLRTIQLHASAVGLKGEIIPLKETTFNIYIQGLFTKLKIGDCFVDAGEGTFEFPKNIPGDVNGNLKIFVRLEENDVYGDVEKIENAKWGNHSSGFVEPTRSLWTSGAPIWMITTLIILLAGVWSHYLYAVIQLIKIRKEGKKIETD
jgi:hypothetical protein